MAILTSIEASFGRLFALSGEMIMLLFSTVLELRHLFRNLTRVLQQMLEIGYKTLPLVAMVGLFIGMIVALHTGLELQKLNLQYVIGGIVGLSMVREMGPMITALIIAGRVGAAMAAELATMTVSEEIDAIRSLGINPVRFLVMPRFFASIIMQPVLTIYAIAIGIWGGALISASQLKVSSQVFFRQLFNALAFTDIATGLFKAFIFGVIYSIVCCQMGITASRGAEGVGKATTKAVVISLTMIIIADYFITRFIG